MKFLIWESSQCFDRTFQNPTLSEIASSSDCLYVMMRCQWLWSLHVFQKGTLIDSSFSNDCDAHTESSPACDASDRSVSNAACIRSPWKDWGQQFPSAGSDWPLRACSIEVWGRWWNKDMMELSWFWVWFLIKLLLDQEIHKQTKLKQMYKSVQ